MTSSPSRADEDRATREGVARPDRATSQFIICTYRAHKATTYFQWQACIFHRSIGHDGKPLLEPWDRPFFGHSEADVELMALEYATAVAETGGVFA